jgi:hypothetical protein
MDGSQLMAHVAHLEDETCCSDLGSFKRNMAGSLRKPARQSDFRGKRKERGLLSSRG